MKLPERTAVIMDLRVDELDREYAIATQLIERTLPAILPHGTNGWPYRYEHRALTRQPVQSTSTTAMVGACLAALSGLLPESDDLLGFAVHPRSDWPDPERIQEGAQHALKHIDGQVAERLSTDDLIVDGVPILKSSLFGDNDPFSLDWLARLLTCAGEASYENLRRCVVEVAKSVVTRAAAAGASQYILGQGSGPVSGDFVHHIWPVVRLGYLTVALESLDGSFEGSSQSTV